MLRRAGIILLSFLGPVLVFAIYSVLATPAAAPLPNQNQRYLIKNVRVLDVDAGAFGPLVSVSTENGRIVDIGPGLAPPNAHILDGGGGFLIPGFWDMHIHSFQTSPQLHFPLFVANGITNVRDMMDCPEAEDSLIACVADKRRWSAVVDSGKLAAPRFVEIASFYFETPTMTPAEAVNRARAYSTRGLDALKVYNRLSPETYRTLGKTAAALDMRLVGHLPRQVGLGDAVAAGQHSFEHARLLLDQCFMSATEWRAGKLDALSPTLLAERMVRDHDTELCQSQIAAMRAADAWFVPTHVTREDDTRASDEQFINDPRLDYLDPLSRWAFNDDQSSTVARYPGARGKQALDAYFAKGLELTGKAHRANLNILVGTDSALGGFRYHDEMAHLVQAGLSPADVLRAATIEAARYANLDSESGSIKIGKRADLILLSADPLANIGNTKKIQAVWLAGYLYDRKGLDKLLDFTKAEASNPANWVRLLWGFANSDVSGEL